MSFKNMLIYLPPWLLVVKITKRLPIFYFFGNFPAELYLRKSHRNVTDAPKTGHPLNSNSSFHFQTSLAYLRSYISRLQLQLERRYFLAHHQRMKTRAELFD